MVLSETENIETFPDTIKIESHWLPEGHTVWLYVITYKDGRKNFFFEQENAVYILDRLENAEDYNYNSEGFLYYKKLGQWYSYRPHEDDDILLGKRIMPNIFVYKVNDVFVVTQEGLRSRCSIDCKSYKLVTNKLLHNIVLIGDVDKDRKYFAIADGINDFISHFFESTRLKVDGEEYYVFRDPQKGLWITEGSKKPEDIYNFIE